MASTRTTKGHDGGVVADQRCYANFKRILMLADLALRL